jgi:hypothetical protein
MLRCKARDIEGLGLGLFIGLRKGLDFFIKPIKESTDGINCTDKGY